MKKYMDVAGKLLIVAVFCLAIWLLYGKLKSFSLNEIRGAIEQISPLSLVLSFGFMILNYLILMGYDWLALKAIKKNLGLARVSLVSFVGSVISLNFGALLGGSTVRYRLYTAWGFTPLEIVRLVLMLAVTFWVGAMGLAGALFIFVPLELPAELGSHFTSVRPLGFGLLAVCILYHCLCYKVDGKSLVIRGKEFALPPFRIAIVQTIVAGVDLIIAAACLYSLFPAQAELTFLDFLPNYLLAQVAVVLTHVPGGFGVLEVVIMNLTTDLPTSTVFAAILIFRVIYYIVPLLFASVLLGLNEINIRRTRSLNVDQAKQSLNDWFLTTMKYLVFVVGVLFCLSVVFPVVTPSISNYDIKLPSYFSIILYLMRGVVGVTLIVFAYGLDRKQIHHWIIIVTALFVGIFILWVSGIGWVSGVLLAPVLFPLLVTRYKFTRDRVPLASHYPLHWLITSITVIGGIMLLTYLVSTLPGKKGYWSHYFAHYNFSAEGTAMVVQVITGLIIGLCLTIADKYYKKKSRRKGIR